VTEWTVVVWGGRPRGGRRKGEGWEMAAVSMWGAEPVPRCSVSQRGPLLNPVPSDPTQLAWVFYAELFVLVTHFCLSSAQERTCCCRCVPSRGWSGGIFSCLLAI
jgi:hypothetical protein